MPESAIVVWDQSDEPESIPGDILYWRSYRDADLRSSVPSYLEAYAERIRGKYLGFIHDLGQSVVAGRRVAEHLDRGDGFSFWWMTTLAEKSPLKSPRIYDCLRLLALEEMLAARPPAALRLVSSDAELAEAMRAMCAKLESRFEWQQRGARPKWSLRRIYTALPYQLKALMSLRHVLLRWTLRKLGRPRWFSGEASIFIASYFIHLDTTQCARGRFHSRQWETLPELLHTCGRRINWMQLFLFSAAVPNVRTGLSWTRQFNADAERQGCHAFLDSYLSVTLVCRALKTWLWLCAVSRRLKAVPAAFTPGGSVLWLWPLLRDDWRRSLSGQIGMNNCLAVVQFDAALAQMPHQHIGLYLYENQAWEKALLRAWRRHGHGRIVGVQHSTAPFWHLYNFEDPRSLSEQGRSALPMPDQIAINGMGAWNAFLAAGYPPGRLVQVEALRYLNLAVLAATRARVSSVDTADSTLQVLILGDMIPSSVRQLLELASGAMQLVRGRYSLTFKPHPGYAVNLADYPGLRAGETREPLAQILTGFDVAVAANSTSAAVDAYVAGLPVIIGLDGDDLNLSPLRGNADVRFVSTSAGLAAAMQDLSPRDSQPSRERSDFFFLDPGLPRWKRLLALAP
jgi:surface carbohydrate biosynthesis protein (TIGR04326 family)